MINKVLIVLNTLALVALGYWFYISREPESFSACIMGTATLIGLVWRETKNRSVGVKQNNTINHNVNSPIVGKVGQQTINYFQTDPQLLKKIEKIERIHRETVKTKNMGKEDKKTNISVTSYNQSGGITANQVNIGSNPRVLNSEVQNQLQQILSDRKGQTIKIVSVMGDGEAFNFATQIKNYLVNQGYIVSGIDQAIYTQPVMGQVFNPEKLEFIIGTKQ